MRVFLPITQNKQTAVTLENIQARTRRRAIGAQPSGARATHRQNRTSHYL